MYFYSPEKDSFFAEQFKSEYVRSGTWPNDAIKVKLSEWLEFNQKTNSEGLQRKYKDGKFSWEHSNHHDISQERVWRNSELARSDIELNKVQDGDSSAVGSVSDWRVYRKQLRAWPENKEFPNKECRPKAPDYKE